MQKDYSKKIQKDLLEILKYFSLICKENNLIYYFGEGTLLGTVRHDGFIPWDDDIDIYMPRDDYNKFLKLKIDNDKFFLDTYRTNKKNWNSYSKIRYKNTEFHEKEVPDFIENQGIWIDIFPVDNTTNNNFSFLKFRKKVIMICRDILYIKNTKTNSNGLNLSKKIKYFIIKKIPCIIFYKLRNFLMTYENNKKNKYYINFASKYSLDKQLYQKEEIFPLIEHKFETTTQFIPRDYHTILSNIYGKDYMTLPKKEKRVTSHKPTKIKFSDGEEIFFK